MFSTLSASAASLIAGEKAINNCCAMRAKCFFVVLNCVVFVLGPLQENPERAVEGEISLSFFSK